MEKEYISDITYPSEEEMRVAQLMCCGRVCNECETPAAYAWRKREVDMALLLEKAIQDELTENEKNIIEDKWYKSLSFSQIARNRCISPAAVKSTSERALKKLEKVLKYVVFYQRDLMNESIVSAVVGRARVIASAKKLNTYNMGERIKKLRLSQGISLNLLSCATEISEERIAEIEGNSIPKTEELAVLSDYFAVTTDYILKGENNV